MSRIALLLCIGCAAFLANVECGISLKNMFQRTSTTEPPTTTTTTTKSLPRFISHNIPKPGAGCTVHFECKKRLKEAEVPKPCLKYCVKSIKCPGATSVKGKADECVELNEELVAQETALESKEVVPNSDGTIPSGRVAMIDFPCQPGYLPDSRGRCREVW